MTIAANDRTLTITLHRDLESGQWLVDQVETRYGPVRNNIRFSIPMNAQDTFSPEFLDQLVTHLPGNLNQQVFTISGPAIVTKTLVTEGMRVLAQTAKHGMQRVIVRFNRVVGRVYDFLTTELRPDILPSGFEKLPKMIGLDSVRPLESKIPSDCLFCPSRCQT